MSIKTKKPGSAKKPTLQRLSLNEVAQVFDVHLSTVFRWAQRGVRGVILETVWVGGRLYTDQKSVDEFKSATEGQGLGKPESQRPPFARNPKAAKRVQNVESQLDAAGL